MRKSKVVEILSGVRRNVLKLYYISAIICKYHYSFKLGVRELAKIIGVEPQCVSYILRISCLNDFTARYRVLVKVMSALRSRSSLRDFYGKMVEEGYLRVLSEIASCFEKILDIDLEKRLRENANIIREKLLETRRREFYHRLINEFLQRGYVVIELDDPVIRILHDIPGTMLRALEKYECIRRIGVGYIDTRRYKITRRKIMVFYLNIEEIIRNALKDIEVDCEGLRGLIMRRRKPREIGIAYYVLRELCNEAIL